jgi:hypothetical protein
MLLIFPTKSFKLYIYPKITRKMAQKSQNNILRKRIVQRFKYSNPHGVTYPLSLYITKTLSYIAWLRHLPNHSQSQKLQRGVASLRQRSTHSPSKAHKTKHISTKSPGTSTRKMYLYPHIYSLKYSSLP